MQRNTNPSDEEKSASLRPADAVASYDEDFDDPIAAPNDPRHVVAWLRAFEPPELRPDVPSLSTALPGYLKQAVSMVKAETRCTVLAFTATGLLHRGVEWLEAQTEVADITQARSSVESAGWSTDPLDWQFPLRGCGPRDHIELRRVGRFHANRVHRLKDVLGLSLRVAGGLCILFGVVDLNLRGAAGRHASDQARAFLGELESRVVLARDLAARALADPAPLTGTPRDQLRRTRYQ